MKNEVYSIYRWFQKTDIMLPIILVVLFASGAWAAPTVEVNINSINEVEPLPSNGRTIGAYLLHNAFDSAEGGEKSVNLQILLHAVADAADLRDPRSQARAIAEAVAVLIEISTGFTGDACAAANFIDSYIRAVRAGNPAAVRVAASLYVQHLVSGINSIVQLVTNPTSARFASGRKGNCIGGGAAYQFEAAWDLAMSNAPAGEPIQEEYCSAKSLYHGFSAISRHVGAAVTAAAQRPIVETFGLARLPVANFLASVGSGGTNIVQAARTAQQALLNAVNNLPL